MAKPINSDLKHVLDIDRFVEDIETKRERDGETYQNITEKVGVSKFTLNRILSQRKLPSVDAFVALMVWLGTPVENYTRKVRGR